MGLERNSVKTCCFIGHRKIEVTEKLKSEIYDFLEDLILEKDVREFLFGSRSEFDNLCHGVVTELKAKYPFIDRLGYTCKSETVTLESEREKNEKLYSELSGRAVRLYGMEREVEHKTKYTAGKASYVERNKAMIDDSDYCVFYYNERYKPSKRRRNKNSGYYQPKSGTAIAYLYAKRKRKAIKNFFDL